MVLTVTATLIFKYKLFSSFSLLPPLTELHFAFLVLDSDEDNGASVTPGSRACFTM